MSECEGRRAAFGTAIAASEVARRTNEPRRGAGWPT